MYISNVFRGNKMETVPYAGDDFMSFPNHMELVRSTKNFGKCKIVSAMLMKHPC